MSAWQYTDKIRPLYQDSTLVTQHLFPSCWNAIQVDYSGIPEARQFQDARLNEAAISADAMRGQSFGLRAAFQRSAAHPIHHSAPMGVAATAQRVLWLRPDPSASPFCRHPPSLPGISPHSAVFCPSRQVFRESPGSRRLETAGFSARISKHTIGKQARRIGFGRFLGLVSAPRRLSAQPARGPNKNLFYCCGCRRGGDIVRFIERYSSGQVSGGFGAAEPVA
jgi:hypothetical protein